MNTLKLLCSVPFFKKIITASFKPDNRGREKNAFGLHFKNPIGLGAGFDKNARYLNELEALGFGFVEIGTVTPLGQEGNEKPRLFRLPKDKALINRMGFNNEGVKAIARRLKEWKEKNKAVSDADRLIIGGNIGKNKNTPNEEAWKDYETCFRELHSCVDYFVINVSSPNTPGLRELQEKDSLRKIIFHLQTINNQQTYPRPLLLKIAPDLSQEQLDDVIDLSMEIRLDGLVIANTTINRSDLHTPAGVISAIGAGGLSGQPVKSRSTEIVQYIHRKTNGAIPIIASGGIFTCQDVADKMAAGAMLVQVWTGFIYEGPGIIKKVLNRGSSVTP